MAGALEVLAESLGRLRVDHDRPVRAAFAVELEAREALLLVEVADQ